MADDERGRPKRTKFEQERDMADVAVMLLRHRTVTEITDWICAHRPYKLGMDAIRRDIRKVNERWRENAFVAIDARKAMELEKLDLIEREAWKAWEDSKDETLYKSSTKKEKEVGSTDDGAKILDSGDSIKTVSTRSNYGDARFLQLVMTCIDKRCEILGIVEVGKVVMQNNQLTAIITGLPNEHVDKLLAEHYREIGPGQNGNGSSAGPQQSN